MRSSDRDSGVGLAAPEGWDGFRRGDYRIVAVVLAVLAAGACVLVGRSLRLGRVSMVIGGLAAVLLCGALVRFGLRYRAERSHSGTLTIAGIGEAAETVVSLAAGHVGTLRVIFGAASVLCFVVAGQLFVLPFDAWFYAAALVVAGVVASWLACFATFPLRGGRGIALSAAGVRVVGHERTRTLVWEEIGDLVPHVRYQVQLPCRWLLLRERRDRFHPDYRIKQTAVSRWSSTEWTDAGIEVACEDLDLDPVTMFHLIRFYQEHPGLRHELGTPASVERVRRRALLTEP